MSLTLTKNEIKSSHLILSSQISRTVMGQFDVEAAGAVPILSGRRHVVRQLTDNLAVGDQAALGTPHGGGTSLVPQSRDETSYVDEYVAPINNYLHHLL
jgi:hypothetical protein